MPDINPWQMPLVEAVDAFFKTGFVYDGFRSVIHKQDREAMPYDFSTKTRPVSIYPSDDGEYETEREAAHALVLATKRGFNSAERELAPKFDKYQEALKLRREIT